MKNILFLLLFSIASLGNAFSASVSLGMWIDTSAGTLSGTLLDDTYTGYLGIFTGSANANSTYNDINPSFTALDSAIFKTSTSNEAGYVEFGSTTYSGPTFEGKQIYVWFTNGSNQNALITGFGNFKLDSDIPNSLALTIESANIGSRTFITGTYNALSPSPYGGGMIHLNNIPEPSTLLLSSLGVLALLRRRR